VLTTEDYDFMIFKGCFEIFIFFRLRGKEADARGVVLFIFILRESS
jgi:hypothetical protein